MCSTYRNVNTVYLYIYRYNEKLEINNSSSGLNNTNMECDNDLIFNNYPAKLCRISPIEQDNCFIIQQIDNKTNNFIWPGKKLFFLQFSLLQRTKLRISQDICYLRMTDIERIMTIFGQCYNLLNNNTGYHDIKTRSLIAN